MKFAEATTNGGISILSAFIDGLGGAFSIDLPLTATVYAGTRRREDRLMEAIRSEFGIKDQLTYKVKSSIPAGYGLKSSSALVLALAKASLLYKSVDIEDADLLVRLANISKAVGLSATGALDDLCQALYGGYCITDNKRMKIIKRGKLPELAVLVCARGETRPSRSINIRGNYFKVARSAENLAQRGFIFQAAVLNGFIYGTIFGIDLETVRKIEENGANYASQSGKGPAVFGLFTDPSDAKRAKMDIGFGIVTKINNHGIRYRIYDS
ncbi:hypothetical protein [Thermoplasma volcanium GSS1]|uniref:Shikimate kinase n=1 Tax=Thermoplasma volcanium (strain ATCC 51530 / DSM 4299 / JCM 9571 / NBRC 15438 / GSS1) TaxID=273116 RepID=Q978S4_THEVO|nr:shikimate kinase [Thermoplasma volcanium]BAB60483.1 hypothetical protein [Thermoplasma volcanium GSS1]